MKKQEEANILNEIEIVFRNGDDIKKDVFILLGLWSGSLNIEYYTQEYFNSESCTTDDWDPMVIAKKRNDFINNELKGLSKEIGKVKDLLQKYHVNTNPRNISLALKTMYKSDKSYFDFLQSLLAEANFSKRSNSINIKMENVSLDEMIYYLSFIYLDLLKVREFLISKFDKEAEAHSKSSEKKKSLDSKGSSLTAKEIAYLEYYMRESKDYSDINKNVNLIHEDFAKMNGGKCVKNIEIAYNKILNDKSERLRNHKKILKVINHMTRHFPQYKKSIQLAEEEYNKAIEKYL